MADYIDKQKTLNVIFEIAENVINSLPSADVVEVVRCKNCQHYALFNNGCNGTCLRYIDTFEVLYPDDFCSFGERKE